MTAAIATNVAAEMDTFAAAAAPAKATDSDHARSPDNHRLRLDQTGPREAFAPALSTHSRRRCEETARATFALAVGPHAAAEYPTEKPALRAVKMSRFTHRPRAASSRF